MLNLQRLAALFLCLFISCVAIGAHGYEVKADLGVTQFTQAANGFWYQDGFPHTLRLTSPSASLKLYSDRSADGWQLGIGIDYIGRATSDAMILDADANYNANTPTHCNGPCGPLSHMQGQGTIPALFSVARKTWTNWFVEGGLYVTRPHWETTNFDWYGGPNNAVGPIYSHLNHEVRNTYDLGAAIGYRFDDTWSAVLKAVPTHATNSQRDPTNPSGVSYYPGIYKAYSPTLAVETTF